MVCDVVLLMLLASTIFMLARLKVNERKTWLILLLLAASSTFSNKSYQFLSEYDEFKFTSLYLSSNVK